MNKIDNNFIPASALVSMFFGVTGIVIFFIAFLSQSLIFFLFSIHFAGAAG